MTEYFTISSDDRYSKSTDLTSVEKILGAMSSLKAMTRGRYDSTGAHWFTLNLVFADPEGNFGPLGANAQKVNCISVAAGDGSPTSTLALLKDIAAKLHWRVIKEAL